MTADHNVTRQVRQLDTPTDVRAGQTIYRTSRMWRLVCTCGWESSERPDPAILRLDKHRHLVAVGVRKQRRSSRPRDGRKSKVYAAEREAFGARQTTQMWSSSADAQRILDGWMDTAWWKARFGVRPIEVISRTSGSSTGDHTHRIINLARIHWNPLVLAHEAAHVLQPSGTAGHGKEWAGIYLALLDRFVSSVDADKLRSAFVASRIPHRYAVKPSRPVETKAAKQAQQRIRDAAMLADLLRRGPDAADIIRAHARAGRFGPAGSKSRRAAFDVARTLETP
jgi:hypothetical protein